ncbi:MAG: outer membrane protein assembly factor BamB family protein [Planctomycetota bacterium]
MRVLVPVLLWVAVAAAGEEWRCARGNLSNTGVVKNRGPVATPQVVWKREEQETIGRGVALAAGRLVYGVGEFVVACRRQTTSTELWNASVKQRISAWPAIANDCVYVGSPDRVHYVFNFDTGKEPGGTEAGAAIVADPAVTADYYLAGATDGIFYVMAPKDARPLWKPKTGPVLHGAAVGRGRAYVVNEKGTVYALDLRKKRELWTCELNAKPLCAPILCKGRLWLPLEDAVQGISTKHGRAETRHALKGIAGAPALAKSLLHYGTDQGEVVVFDVSKGKELRRVKVAEGAVSVPLILARGVLYGAAGSTLFAVDAKRGNVLWTFEGEEKFQPPIVADKAIYVAAGEVFYCLR